MPLDMGPFLLGVECKKQGCATFFATPLQLSPDAYGELEDVDTAYRCPRCSTIHRYAKREHVFLLLDDVA